MVGQRRPYSNCPSRVAVQVEEVPRKGLLELIYFTSSKQVLVQLRRSLLPRVLCNEEIACAFARHLVPHLIFLCLGCESAGVGVLDCCTTRGSLFRVRYHSAFSCRMLAVLLWNRFR